MSNPTSNFGWQMPTPVDLVTDLPADFEVFGQAVDSSLADLKGGTTGQVLSKASNTDMDFTWVAQDDSNAIQNAIVDAKGDLIAATAADTPARLAVGTNGQVLTADSTAATGLVWASPASSAFSGVYCTGTANQTLNATTETAITWDAEVYDTDSFHSTSTNTTRITIPTGKSGYYAISAKVIWEASATGGHRTVYLKKNGSTYLHGGTSNTPNSTVGIGVDIVMTLNLTAGDYIEIAGYQNSGGTLPVAKNTSYPASYFIAQYLGA